MAFATGQTLSGYTILEPIGRGGMGAVYKAEDSRGQVVAIKVLAPELCRDAVSLERFLREARAVAALSHPHITKLLDIGQEGEARFLVLEYLPGGTLHDRLRFGRVPWRDLASIGAKVAAALAAVHAAGLVHRDVKPANVILDEKGEPRLADFGLVRATSLEASGALTRTGEFVGTLEFIAPEQANATGGKIGPACDLYSLGATLYTLATGRYPFVGTGYALVKKHLTEAPVPPRSFEPEMPERLEQVILRLLEKDPQARGTTAAAARDLALVARRGGGSRVPRAGTLALVTLVAAAGVAGAVLVGRAIANAASEPPKPVPVPVGDGRSLDAKEAQRLLDRARSRMKSRDFAGAVEDASKAIDLEPKLAEAWLVRADAGSQDGKFLTAITDVSYAIQLDPKLARAFAIRAEIYAAGKPEAALEDAKRAIELDPRLAHAWYVRGVVRRKLGDLDGAVSDATHAIELEPKDATAWRVRGAARLDQHDYRSAASDLARSVELEPSSPQGWGLEGEAWLGLGDLDRALEKLNKALVLQPGWTFALVKRSRARALKVDEEGAGADLATALVQDPGCAEAWFFRGLRRLEKGDFAGALPDLTKAVELSPRDERMWFARGNARSAIRDFAGAVADLTRALELEPLDADAHRLRGISRVFMGDRAGGTSDLRRFLELEPRSPYAEHVRAQLSQLEER
ncbi:protein kinase [bacterium]|nr:protein kinase [bacterium]